MIGFRLTERSNDQTFAAFSSVRVKISPASLRKRAFIISRAQISAPYLHLVRSGANRYNFSDLLQGKQQKTGQQKTPLFSINNIEISNGAVDFMTTPAVEQPDIRCASCS